MFLRPFETSAPRTAASIHLGSVVAVCILAALSMPGLPMANGASSPKLVRVVGAPETNKLCGNQTWPYIEERCLTRAATQSAPGPTPSTQTPQTPQTPQTQAASAAPTSGAGNPSAELSPLTASGKVVPGKASASTDFDSRPADAVAAQTSTNGMAFADEQDEAPPMQPEPRKRHHRHHGFFFGFRF